MEAALKLLKEVVLWREVVEVAKRYNQESHQKSPMVCVHKTDKKGQPVVYVTETPLFMDDPANPESEHLLWGSF